MSLSNYTRQLIPLPNVIIDICLSYVNIVDEFTCGCGSYHNLNPTHEYWILYEYDYGVDTFQLNNTFKCELCPNFTCMACGELCVLCEKEICDACVLFCEDCNNNFCENCKSHDCSHMLRYL